MALNTIEPGEGGDKSPQGETDGYRGGGADDSRVWKETEPEDKQKEDEKEESDPVFRSPFKK